MPASSDFKGLPLQTSLKVHSEPKGLFPAVTNTPRFATSAPFQIPTKVNAGRCKHGCRGSAVRIAAGDLTAADLRPAIASHPSHRPFPEKRAPARDAKPAALSKEAAMTMTTGHGNQRRQAGHDRRLPCGSGAVGRVPTYAGQTPAAGVTFCPDRRWNSPPAIRLIFRAGVCRLRPALQR
jgi:hypothetical protein